MPERKRIAEKYSRQTLFSPIGESGQHKLLSSRIAIVGMGALGTVLANHMARAGIGYLRLIDRDFVEASNLQRQMLYDERDAAESAPKALAAASKLRQINSDIEIDPVVADLNSFNAETLLSDVHLILDGSDNFAVRFLINDISVKFGIPWIYGGAVSSRGVISVILPGETPCFRCLFEHAPAQGTAETCDTVGVIGPIVHVVASYQAAEALKWLTDNRNAMNKSMIHFDLWQNMHTSIDFSEARKSSCPCCSKRQFEYLDANYEGETVQSLCGRNAVQIFPVTPRSLSLEEWERKLMPIGRVERNPFLLKFHINHELRLVLFPDGRVIVQGTGDAAIAKSLYSRYIGM